MAEPIIFEITISYLLSRLATAFRSSIERHLAEIDLHSGQTLLLMELWREDGIRQIDLARRLNVKAPTVSNMITSLKSINLIRTESSEGDGRSVRVFLTGKGRLIRNEVEKRWIDIEQECISGLRSSDQVFLQEILQRLLATYTDQKYVEEE